MTKDTFPVEYQANVSFLTDFCGVLNAISGNKSQGAK